MDVITCMIFAWHQFSPSRTLQFLLLGRYAYFRNASKFCLSKIDSLNISNALCKCVHFVKYVFYGHQFCHSLLLLVLLHPAELFSFLFLSFFFLAVMFQYVFALETYHLIWISVLIYQYTSGFFKD